MQSACDLGAAMVERGYGLVYGGSRTGLMGAIANAVLDAGGEAIGISVHGLANREPPYAGLTELHLMNTMHERKAMMERLSDAFITLPGGIGTLEEFFENVSWAMLGIHRKPFGLLNVEGYYSGLLQFLDYTVHEGFVREVNRALIQHSPDPHTLLDLLEAYQPSEHVPAWISRAET